MIKHIIAATIVVALAACSSDSSDSGSGNAGTVTPPTGNNGGGNNNGGGTVNATGLPGVWSGQNNFGSGVMIIDANQNVYALTADGNGDYETVFGPASGQLDHFFHRNSPNTSYAGVFTMVGDLPSQRDPNVTVETITYNLQLQSDDQQVSNNSGVGAFTMNRVGTDTVPAISVGDIAGTWSVLTSYCAADCDLRLSLTIAADGSLTGFTQNNNDPQNTLEGNVTTAAGANQYLGVSFNWLGTSRAGVIYRDPGDNSRLIINTVGPSGDRKETITAYLVRS